MHLYIKVYITFTQKKLYILFNIHIFFLIASDKGNHCASKLGYNGYMGLYKAQVTFKKYFYVVHFFLARNIELEECIMVIYPWLQFTHKM